MDNRHIADRLDSFAALLELAEANPYTARAYRRAAETIRGAALPVVELVRTGRVRQLRGIGSGIEARLRELVETGEIAELAELERELAPDMVGLGRYLGLSARRSIELARALGVRSAEEFREAAAAGRLRSAPGIGPKMEARLLEALAGAGESAASPGAAFESRAGAGRRAWRPRSMARSRAMCGAGATRASSSLWCAPQSIRCRCSARFGELPQIVGLVEAGDRRAVGVTVDGVPIELTVAEPRECGTALLRATGAPTYVEALEPLPRGA